MTKLNRAKSVDDSSDEMDDQRVNIIVPPSKWSKPVDCSGEVNNITLHRLMSSWRCSSAAQAATLRLRLARRERRNRQRIQRLKEYHRLRSMVPTIATTPNVDKVTVIEEAIRYIDHLHDALMTKFQQRGLPVYLKGESIDLASSNIQEIVRLIAEKRPLPPPSAPAQISESTIRTSADWSFICERHRSHPSFLEAKLPKKSL